MQAINFTFASHRTPRSHLKLHVNPSVFCACACVSAKAQALWNLALKKPVVHGPPPRRTFSESEEDGHAGELFEGLYGVGSPESGYDTDEDIAVVARRNWERIHGDSTKATEKAAVDELSEEDDYSNMAVDPTAESAAVAAAVADVVDAVESAAAAAGSAADTKVARKKRMSEEEKASEEEQRYQRLWKRAKHPESVLHTIYDTREDVKFINDLNVLNARDGLEKLSSGLFQAIHDFRDLVKKRKAEKLEAVEQQKEKRKDQTKKSRKMAVAEHNDPLPSSHAGLSVHSGWHLQFAWSCRCACCFALPPLPHTRRLSVQVHQLLTKATLVCGGEVIMRHVSLSVTDSH